MFRPSRAEQICIQDDSICIGPDHDAARGYGLLKAATHRDRLRDRRLPLFRCRKAPLTEEQSVRLSSTLVSDPKKTLPRQRRER